MKHGQHADPVQQINDHHADDLLAAARAFGGHPDATAARADRVDRHGVDLLLDTPGGPVAARVDFSPAVAESEYPVGIRIAFVRLARRARDILDAERGEDAVESERGHDDAER